MTGMRKTGWSACRELKEKSIEKSNIGASQKIKTLVHATENGLGKMKTRLKWQLPVLTNIGIRRYQLPNHEAVILELEESGMKGSAEFLRSLFEFDEKFEYKKLRLHPNLVDQIKKGLIDAETAEKNGDKSAQTSAILKIALFFQSLTPECYWIADEFFTRALSVAENIENDNAETLNTIRFLYGRFLFYQLKNPERALNYLNKARKSCERDPRNASKFFGKKQDNLLKECNSVLLQVFLLLAEQWRKQDPQSAVKASFHALKRAQDFAHEDSIAKALYELGKSQMASDNVDKALKTYSTYLAKVKRISDFEGIVNGYMEIAFAHKELGDADGTMRYLSLFRDSAASYYLPQKLAEAHYLSGEFLLQQGELDLAVTHLETAFGMFKELGLMERMDETRLLVGISKGQQIEDDFLNFISKSNANDQEAMKKLLDWRNGRVFVWIIN